MTETKMKDSPQDKEIKRSELNEDVSITSEEVKEEFSFMETIKKVFVLSIAILFWLVGAYVCGKL